MQAKVSFTQKVKEEICSLTFSDEHLRALLSAFIRINGSLNIGNKRPQIVVKTESAKTAKFIYYSVERVYGLTCRFSYSKTMNFRKRLTYNVIIDEGEYLLDDFPDNPDAGETGPHVRRIGPKRKIALVIAHQYVEVWLVPLYEGYIIPSNFAIVYLIIIFSMSSFAFSNKVLPSF